MSKKENTEAKNSIMEQLKSMDEDDLKKVIRFFDELAKHKKQ